MASVLRRIRRNVEGGRHSGRMRGWHRAGMRGYAWFQTELERRAHLIATQGITHFGRIAR